MRATTAAFAALLAACAGLGWVSWETSQSASDAAAKASREISDAQAETASVREAFAFVSKFGQAVMFIQDKCRREEGSNAARIMFTFKPNGTPDRVAAECHERTTGT